MIGPGSMAVSMLGTAGQELARLRKIAAVIGKYGYAEFVRRSPELPGDLQTQDFDSPESGNASPRRFRLMLEELGPTFIKFGQLLSARPDLVSREYVDALRTLQDQCEPLPFSKIHEVIEDALGQPIEARFDRIEEQPLATASIAQVHRGRTKEGQRVVIKVRRPGIVEQVRRDIDLLYRIARLLDAVVAESDLAEPVGIVREFDRALAEELNFQNEAANIREFAALHRARSDILIPEVIDRLSSSSVLTMTELDGVPFSRLPEDADRRAIAERLVREAFDQVFIDGVFHADPHPGNLMYCGRGQYGILDLGLLGRLTPDMQETLVALALAVAVRDADTVARTLYRLGRSTERVDLAALRRDTEDLFSRYLDRSIQDVDSAVMAQEILNLGMKHRLRIPPEYTMLGRAGATVEGIVRELHPEIDVGEVARPYAERLLVERMLPEDLEGGVYRTLLQLQGLSQDVPLQVSQILSDLSTGRFRIDVTGRELERLTNSLLMSATTLAGAILGGAFIVGSFIGMAQLEWTLFGVPLVGLVGAAIGGFVMAWVAGYILLRPRLEKISVLRFITRRRSRES